MKRTYIIFCTILCLILCGCSKKELKFEDLLSYNSIDEIKEQNKIKWEEATPSMILIKNVKFNSYTGFVTISISEENKLDIHWTHEFESKDELKNNETKINEIISKMNQEYGETNKKDFSDSKYIIYSWNDILNNKYIIGIYTNLDTPTLNVTYTKQI